jgi:hypothetical protein
MTAPNFLLMHYRRVLDHIHEGGNIYYSKERMAAYCIIAKLASEERRAQ